MIPFTFSSGTGKTNLWWKRSRKVVALGKGGGEETKWKEHEGAIWGDGMFFILRRAWRYAFVKAQQVYT